MESLEHINPLEHLELFAKQVVEGFITGMHKSPYHGFSVEFAEHRMYNTGESTRHIDWKLFGRTDKLFVKRYEEETNLRCQMVLDTSSSMFYPNFGTASFAAPNKLSYSVCAIAALTHLLQKQRDAVGISTYADAIQLHTPSKTTTRHHRLLYHELKNVLKIDALKTPRKSASAESIHQIAEMIHKRSLVMVFTDMIAASNLEALFASFKHLKYNNHEVILFHLNEPNTESDLAFGNRPHKFIDVESGASIKLNPAELQNQYKKRAAAYHNELKLNCMKYKIDLVEVDINKGFDQILIAYLLKRQKMF